MPSIFSGLRIALPVSIIVVVITEMIGNSIGLGYYITIWSTRFTFANVYAAIVVIGICGLALDQALLPCAAAPFIGSAKRDDDAADRRTGWRRPDNDHGRRLCRQSDGAPRG